MELWKDIAGYEGLYQISDCGRVKSFSPWKNGECLVLGIRKSGYAYVNLVKPAKHKTFTIHRLVATSFLPNLHNFPQVNHKDGNKLNNCVDNLEWCTSKHNINHALINKLRIPKTGADNKLSKCVVQLTKDGTVVREWGGVSEVCKALSYSANSISCCCNKKPKYNSAYGYLWRYKE